MEAHLFCPQICPRTQEIITLNDNTTDERVDELMDNQKRFISGSKNVILVNFEIENEGLRNDSKGFESDRSSMAITQFEFLLRKKIWKLLENSQLESQAANFFAKKEIEQPELFHWMDLDKHYPLIGTMIL